MKKIILFTIVLLAVLSGQAQNSSALSSEDFSIGAKGFSVIIVPFESKMYLSNVGGELMTRSGLGFQDLKMKFRAALDREVFLALQSHCKPLSFFTLPPDEAELELDYLYSGLGYDYVLLPVKDEVGVKKMFSKLIKKKQEEVYMSSGIRNGEIISQVDDREKYMKTVLLDKKLLPNLKKRYQAGYCIFINQLDINRSVQVGKEKVPSVEEREVKVHFTILEVGGKEVASGAVKLYFYKDQNEMDAILNVQFPLVAEQIVQQFLDGISVAN